MYFDAKPIDLDGATLAKGDPAGVDEMFEATRESQLKINNQYALADQLEKEIDARNDEILKATGEKLDNPFRMSFRAEDVPAYMKHLEGKSPTDMPGFSLFDFNRSKTMAQSYYFDRYEKRLKELADQKPDLAHIIRATEPPSMVVARRMRETEEKTADVFGRRGWTGTGVAGTMWDAVRDLPGTAAMFGGSLAGQAYSFPDMAANLVGLSSGASMSIVRSALRNAVSNMAVQTALEPGVAAQRTQAGLDYGAVDALNSVLGAGAFGFAIDAIPRSINRPLVNRFGPNTPAGSFLSRNTERGGFLTDAPVNPIPGVVVDPGQIQAATDVIQAAQGQARNPELQALVDKASKGDIEAVRELASRAGVLEDPTIKGMFDHARIGGFDPTFADRVNAEFERVGLKDRVDVGETEIRQAKTVVAAMDPTAEPFPVEAMRFVNEQRFPDLSNDADLPAGTTGTNQHGRYLEIDGRTATVRSIDLKLATAADDIKTPRGRVDGLRGAWDQGQAGRVLALEGKDGALRIVDGRGRLELAQRSQGEARAEAVVFRESDGWSLKDVEGLALLKNIREGKGDVVEAATVFRERPELLEGVLAATDFERQALALSRLSDAAFEMVQTGKADPRLAAVVAQYVGDQGRHAGVLDDLARMGVRDPDLARQTVPDLVPPRETAAANHVLLGVREGFDDAVPTLRGGAEVDEPLGSAAKAQTDRLGQELAPEVALAQKAAKQIADMEEKVADLQLELRQAEADAKAKETFADPDTKAPMARAEVDSIVESWRFVREMRRAKAPVSLVEFLRGAGGIRDDATEVRHIIGAAKERPGLVSKNGLTLDDATLMAWERGYLGTGDRPEINTLLDAIAEDVRGNRVYSEADAEFAENIRLAREMEADLGRYGIDWARREADIYSYFARVSDEGVDGDQAAIGGEVAAKRAELHQAETDLANARRGIDGEKVYHLTMDAIANKRSQDVILALSQALGFGEKITPSGTKIRVMLDDEMRVRGQDGTWHQQDASSDLTTGEIKLAIAAVDPMAKIGHEAVHTLVTKGHLSPDEVKQLAALAREAKTFADEAKYRDVYADRPNLETLIDEEAAASYIEARIKGTVKGPANTIVERVKQLLERIKQALAGFGFKSREDVVQAILNGEAARRAPVQEWMRANDVTAVARKDGKMFAFAGENARTADKDALAKAREMETAGEPRETIWTKTGWFRGVDGKWRFEISDDKVMLAGSQPRQPGNGYEANGAIRDLVIHKRLFDAYPQVGEINAYYDVAPWHKETNGSFWGKESGQPLYIDAKSNKISDVKTVLLHELQHAVQEHEGFSPGGSKYSMSGEVEARAVEARQNMTPEERAARPPWMDYDVSEEQQIVSGAQSVTQARAAMRRQAETGVELPDGTKINGVKLYAIRAFHGSPHDFDRFDLSKIGTGQGAQAQGHGLYFAENEAVARDYRVGLSADHSGRVVAEINGKRLDPEGMDYNALTWVHEAGGDYQKAIANFTQIMGDGWPTPDAIRRLEARAKAGEKIETFKAQDTKGRLYEVSIAAEPRDFLDLDLPLMQQSDAVQRLAREKLGRLGYELSSRHTGQDLLTMVAAEHGADTMSLDSVAATKTLRDAGIPGTRYLDQGSRTARRGSRNYVVFDDNLIEIVAKDGAPVQGDKLYALRSDLDMSPEARKQALIDDDPSPKDQIKATVRAYAEAYRDLKGNADALGVSPDDLAELVQRSPDSAPIAQRLEAARAQLAQTIGDEQATALTRALIAAAPLMPDVEPRAIADMVDNVLDQMFPDPPPPKPDPSTEVPTPLQKDMIDMARLEEAQALVSVCRGI